MTRKKHKLISLNYDILLASMMFSLSFISENILVKMTEQVLYVKETVLNEGGRVRNEGRKKGEKLKRHCLSLCCRISTQNIKCFEDFIY